MSDLRQGLERALAGRYTVDRELGRGGMAVVFLAHDLKHKRPVAIKVLTPEIARTVGPERFLREIEVAARLTHPHILPVFDSGDSDGPVYYVMPYVKGESLRDRLKRESTPTLSSSRSWPRRRRPYGGSAGSRARSGYIPRPSPEWRNGRRAGLKIRCRQRRESSTLSSGILAR